MTTWQAICTGLMFTIMVGFVAGRMVRDYRGWRRAHRHEMEAAAFFGLPVIEPVDVPKSRRPADVEKWLDS